MLKTQLTPKVSKRNFFAFIWHGIFLSLATNFTDVHSIIPALLIKAGANSILLGLLSAIMMGGSGIMQIVFANKISTKPLKKKSLLLGINLRVLALFLLALIITFSSHLSNFLFILMIFLLITIFSFSGSYAAISYVDIIGKSILNEKRKKFFSLRQTISSIGILFSAFLVRNILKKYPDNYSILFFISSILLLIASMGFWMIKEPYTKSKRKESFLSYLKKIPSELKKNPNLKYYLLTINTSGLIFGFLPFIILFAKNEGKISSGWIGNILMLKVIGMSVASIILYHINYNYKPVLFFSVVLGICIPLLPLIFRNYPILYQYIFIIAGIYISSFSIAKSGILIEISNFENRAIYTGIAGAGYILPLIFPLLIGFMIKIFGFYYTFIFVSIVIASGIYFSFKLNCETKELSSL